MPINPDDIPTRIEFSRVRRISPLTGNTIITGEDDAAAVIAHHWPAIERHIREQIAQQLYDQNPDRDADFTAGVDWAIDTIRSS